MKKLVSIIVLVCLLGAPAYAQQDILKGSTAYPLGPIVLIDSSDHIAGKTGCASPSLKKITKGFGSAVTPSGTWTELDSTNFPGTYYFTGNATDTNTDGPIVAEVHCSGADPFTGNVGTVVEFDPRAATTLQNIVDAILNELCSAHTTLGSVCKQITDIKAKSDQMVFTVTNQVDSHPMSIASNAITAASIATDADAEIRLASAVIQKSTARTIIFKMVNSTTGAAMTSGTPTCTRAIDSTTFTSTTSSPSAVSALGFVTLALSTSDTNATSFTAVRCTLISANDYNNVFYIN